MLAHAPQAAVHRAEARIPADSVHQHACIVAAVLSHCPPRRRPHLERLVLEGALCRLLHGCLQALHQLEQAPRLPHFDARRRGLLDGARQVGRPHAVAAGGGGWTRASTSTCGRHSSGCNKLSLCAVRAIPARCALCTSRRAGYQAGGRAGGPSQHLRARVRRASAATAARQRCTASRARAASAVSSSPHCSASSMQRSTAAGDRHRHLGAFKRGGTGAPPAGDSQAAPAWEPSAGGAAVCAHLHLHRPAGPASASCAALLPGRPAPGWRRPGAGAARRPPCSRGRSKAVGQGARQVRRRATRHGGDGGRAAGVSAKQEVPDFFQRALCGCGYSLVGFLVQLLGSHLEAGRRAQAVAERKPAAPPAAHLASTSRVHAAWRA